MCNPPQVLRVQYFPLCCMRTIERLRTPVGGKPLAAGVTLNREGVVRTNYNSSSSEHVQRQGQ